MWVVPSFHLLGKLSQLLLQPNEVELGLKVRVEFDNERKLNEMKSSHAEVSFWQGLVWLSEMSCILWPSVGTAAFNLNKIFLARATLFMSLLTCNQ